MIQFQCTLFVYDFARFINYRSTVFVDETIKLLTAGGIMKSVDGDFGFYRFHRYP